MIDIRTLRNIGEGESLTLTDKYNPLKNWHIKFSGRRYRLTQSIGQAPVGEFQLSTVKWIMQTLGATS